MLQRLADFHGEEIIVHQAADRFACKQVRGKRFEQCVRQRVAMDDAAGLALFVEHGERIEVGLAAEGFQYRRGGRIALHGGLVVEQGAEVAAFVIQRDSAAIVFGHQGASVAGRMFLRAAEQVALHQVDAHFSQHREFFRQLDPLGNHLRARGFGDLQNRTDKLSFQCILMNAINEMPVDLHVIRTQFRPQAQARIPCTQVVQRNGKTHRPIVMQSGLQQLKVIDWRLLGELDDHLARRNAQVLQQLQRSSGLVRGFEQGFRRDVEEQLARQLLLIEAATGALSAGDLQFAQSASLSRHGEQCNRRVKRAVGRATGQGFVTENAAFGKTDDRLEQAV